MKALRQIHLYLGCLFAPLIIYFSMSGAWQVFRLNDIPKNESPTAIRSLFHELSKPHKSSTLPGQDPKTGRSTVFNWIAFSMALGLISTTMIGLLLAFRYNRSTRLVWFCLLGGILLPILFLFLR